MLLTFLNQLGGEVQCILVSLGGFVSSLLS